MKIGIYKPFKKVFFKPNDIDHAGWSFEVVNFAKILAEHNHDVYILSQTDLQDDSIHNIHFKSWSLNEQYDRIFVFCGTLNENEYAAINHLRLCTDHLDFIYTDLNLSIIGSQMFDNIYTQSKQQHTYGCLEQLVAYQTKFEELEEVLKHKKIDYYFGGTERKRLDDYIEYIWRPECQRAGKSAFFNFNNYIAYNQHLEQLKKTKYSIVIADTEYNKIGWVTPRYYENIMNDVICFVDAKYDTDCILLQKKHFRVVATYKEMKEKIDILEQNHNIYLEILYRQRQEITQEIISGKNIYDIIMKDDK